jgi:hypothetical protein
LDHLKIIKNSNLEKWVKSKSDEHLIQYLDHLKIEHNDNRPTEKIAEETSILDTTNDSNIK